MYTMRNPVYGFYWTCRRSRAQCYAYCQLRCCLSAPATHRRGAIAPHEVIGLRSTSSRKLYTQRMQCMSYRTLIAEWADYITFYEIIVCFHRVISENVATAGLIWIVIVSDNLVHLRDSSISIASWLGSPAVLFFAQLIECYRIARISILFSRIFRKTPALPPHLHQLSTLSRPSPDNIPHATVDYDTCH